MYRKDIVVDGYCVGGVAHGMYYQSENWYLTLIKTERHTWIYNNEPAPMEWFTEEFYQAQKISYNYSDDVAMVWYIFVRPDHTEDRHRYLAWVNFMSWWTQKPPVPGSTVKRMQRG